MAPGPSKLMEKWYFSKEYLANSPSRKCGVDADKELSYRQQAANFIQDLGQKLEVSQLCINTAIVYMHRFYVFHSMTQFHRNAIAAAAVFLAAKVEEQPRKLEHVIKMAHICLHRDAPPPDVRSETYLEQAQDLVFNENALLQTLGFDVAIDHPHTHVVTCCQLVKASKDLAKTSYFMASNSLHLTTMCLQYKPTVVACFCIHLACKWTNWEIPQSTEGKPWFWYVDQSVTSELLQDLTDEFFRVFDKCPSRLKRKIVSITATQGARINPSQPFDVDTRKTQSPAPISEAGPSSYHGNRPHQAEKQDERKQNVAGPSRASVEYREYREKKDRERAEREKPMTVPSVTQNHAMPHYPHYHKTSAMMKQAPPVPTIPKIPHHNHHHRPDMKPGQVVPLRHGSQGRDPNRDPNRQRVPRDYNTSSGTSSTDTSLHPHSHGMPKDPNLDNASTDSGAHKSDVGSINSIPHGNMQEKVNNNNNHSGHRLAAIDKLHHEKRMHDPRRKPPVDHRKDNEQKPYNKYPAIDPTVPRLVKPEVEQRTEEVRKLIEKPLPPPKSTIDMAYGSSTQKPMHHSKYNQSEKVQSGLPIDPKSTSGSFSQDKSPSSSTSLFHQKPKTTSQHAAHGVSQILKDTIRNGNSQPLSFTSLNNLDDPKTDKRLRHDETDCKSDQNIQQTSTTKQKSLFSPEKIPTPRESHSQRPKNKQKTPPAAVKLSKAQEHFLEAPWTGFGLISPFAISPGSQNTQSIKRPASDVLPLSHKKHRSGNTSDNAQVKQKEETLSFEAAKMHPRAPELMQSIRDNPLMNDRAAQITNSVKPPELVTPFEYESPLVSNYGQNQPLTNGLDATLKSEPQEFQIKKDQYGKSDVPVKVDQIKSNYWSPMKSAQGISRMLQEPLAPMSSLLQNAPQYNQVPSEIHQEVAQTKPPPPPPQQHPMPHSLLVAQESIQMPLSSVNESVIASTVDISAISVSVVTTAESVLSVPMSTTLAVAPSVEEKKSEHHKSEKKKKKEKHKHKDKDKSKERHKHKHKDKDKEKHREKDKEKPEEVVPAVPIKITIPKDKLNLSSESTMVNTATTSNVSSDKNKSPQNTSIKIIIPKDRLKGTDSVSSSPQTSQSVVQPPLKIKISRSAPSTSSGSSVSVGEFANENNRKRDRSDLREAPPTSAPPAKKQSLVPSTGYGQHRPGERQNGRHYSANNNKVRGGGRGGRPYVGRGRPPMAGSAGQYGAHRDGYYQQDAYNSNNVRNNPYPPVHGDPGYWRTAAGGRPVSQTQPNSYDFTNYPPPMYPAGYMPYDPASQLFYQQYQQQYAMYPAGHNVIMTSGGAIDTSVPPPSLPPNLRQNQNTIVASGRQEPKTPPPLPSGPPPSPSPPPPPPPE